MSATAYYELLSRGRERGCKPTITRRRAYAQSAAGSIFIACANVARDRGNAVRERRAGAAVAPTHQAAPAKSGANGEAHHYAGTGENADGRPHSLRQPQTGYESAQESRGGNHRAR